MAWQTPKTDWGAADGVRDSDFNRIEGNILELYNTSGLKANSTVYVNASTGNDNTGAGTAASPYKTINKALSMFPKHVGSFEATVNIAAGTYNEQVIVKGFTGPITLTGAASAAVYITSLVVDACVCRVTNISLYAYSSGTPIEVINGGTLLNTSGSIAAETSSTGTTCVSVINMSSLLVSNILSCYGPSSGASGTGLICNYGSRAHIRTIAGRNKTNGIEAGNGSVISYVENTMTVTGTAMMTFTGGRIYSGSQASIPMY